MPHQAYFNLPEEKQERLRLAALELFSTLPYEEVTTRKLVQKAGISMGSLYQYFSSKDDIYIYYIDEVYKVNGQQRDDMPDQRATEEMTPLEMAFIDSMFRAPAEVLEKFYFRLTGTAFKNGIKYFEKRKKEGLVPADADEELYTFLQSGLMFCLLMYGRAFGITDPQESRKLFDEKWQTIRHFCPPQKRNPGEG